MRVIAGKAGSLRLKTIAGANTRPTTDRIKETLFNMIRDMVPEAQFLDLFAGSGQIGIEALSRGAARAVFAESNPKAAAVIRENLGHTGLAADAEVYPQDVLGTLSMLSGRYVFDVVFMDPPYDLGIEEKVLAALRQFELIDGNSLIIVEARRQTELPDLAGLGYRVIKEKIYTTNKHVFLELNAE